MPVAYCLLIGLTGRPLNKLAGLFRAQESIDDGVAHVDERGETHGNQELIGIVRRRHYQELVGPYLSRKPKSDADNDEAVDELGDGRGSGRSEEHTSELQSQI